MFNETKAAILADFQEAVGVPETEVLYLMLLNPNDRYTAYAADPDVVFNYRAAVERCAANPQLPDPLTELNGLAAKLENLVPEIKKPLIAVPRSSRCYRLLKVEADWTTIPQVHAILAVLGAHMKVGEVRSEADVIAMMEANARVLDTVQPPKRIWDYYKGAHNLGLCAHGNLEKI